MQTEKSRIIYVGQLRTDCEREDFFGDVLSTMVFDLCGITHATGTAVGERCAGCGECMILGTYGLVPSVQGRWSW